MLRFVLDTNVFVSALLSPYANPAQILDGFLEGRWELLVSPEILQEYETVLVRRKFVPIHRSVREAIIRLKQTAFFVFPGEMVRACSDPADDKFLACSIAGKATHLVTGNKKHFPKSSFMGVLIVSPTDLITELQ